MAAAMTDHDQSKKRNRVDRKRLTPEQEQQVLANLNDVDNTLLMRLYDLRYLRTDQVHALVYTGRKKEYVWQRLNELHRRQLIGNLKIRQGRSTIALWHLDRLGLEVTEDMLGVPPEERLPPKEHKVSAKYARHFVEAADIYVALQKRLGNSGAWEWLNHRTRYQYGSVEIPAKKGGGHRPLWLIPDGTISLDYGREVSGKWTRQGTWTTYLELDRSTMRLAIMGEKFDKYVEWLAQQVSYGIWDGRDDIDHYILVVCPSSQRAANLQALLDERRLPGRAVTQDRAMDMLCGGLSSWWASAVKAVHDREQEAARAEERRRRAEESAAEQWVIYLDSHVAWKSERDEWARRRFEGQLLKTRDVEYFKALFSQEVKAAPVEPASSRPDAMALGEARTRLAKR
ncbi:MAG TPA: replication-relaxation family protein [Symbiobacteriaceae bacterium]|nr:replication-relaxation family protein [Symbiobacteriaceae bacterium]